ncbi:MAG: hypothetical protein Q8O67_13745 [Deltaproteobacteria bacterium]|nr:hypothetical protein [Deltaproteobacteria bacterium]
MRALVVVVAFSTAAAADIAPDTFHGGTGLQVQDPEAAAKIQMKKERVTITLHNAKEGAFAVVDATFSMSGPKATKLNIVFPGEGVKVGDAFRVHPRLIGFHAFVDGKPVASHDDVKDRSTKSGPPGREYTKHRSETWHGFPATVDDDTTIRVRYAVAAAGVRADENGDVNGYASVGYVLHTGALWAKDIGEATIEIKAAGDVDLKGSSLRSHGMPPVSFVSLTGDAPPPPVQPATAIRTPAAITWTLQNLEPTENDDVEVVFPSTAPATWGAPSEALAAVMTAAAR